MSTTATRTRGMLEVRGSAPLCACAQWGLYEAVEVLEVCAQASEMRAGMSAGDSSGVALVTGANRGIGKEVARQLAQRGYEVLLSARDGEQAAAVASELQDALGGSDAQGEQSDGARGSVRPLRLDVADVDSIAAAAQQVRTDVGRLDVLVNNAGIGSDFGVAGVAPDFEAMQQELDTNFYGAYRLTVALLDLLRESSHPRIVNVSSGMGGVTEMGGWSPGYRVSKAAMNAMTRILSSELKEAGFLINSACPGFVDTDMGGPMGAKKPVQDGAAGIVWLATLPHDGPTGGFFRDGAPVAF
jgi:NAD(P)-dependent dehydrogenase (short-subunit alcohol dehydrogenase family)